MTQLVSRPRTRANPLKRTLGPGVVEWMERNLVHGPGDVEGQPYTLDEDQTRFLLNCYKIDDAGRRVIRRAVYSRSKGRAKSELAGAVCVAEALGPVRFGGWDAKGYPIGVPVKSPLVRVAATEEGQTDNVYANIVAMLRQGPLSRRSGLDVGLTRVVLPGGSGKIVPITARANSKDGGKESFAVFDETHLYTSPELRKMYDTIRRNLGKRKAAEPWALETTTMYSPGEQSVAESSHELAKKVEAGELDALGFLFDHRSAPKLGSFDYDNDRALLLALAEAYGEAAAWMDLEALVAYARESTTKKSDFVRFFLNLPSADTGGKWFEDEEWAKLGNPAWTIPPGSRVGVGIDGSHNHDCTAVSWASRTEGGKIRLKSQVFSVRHTVPHHEFHEGGTIDYGRVEGFVQTDLFGTFNVSSCAYDPRFLARSAQIIEDNLPEAAVVAVEPQSRLMRDALATFHRVVKTGLLEHDGDSVLARHIAATRASEDESGWRLRKTRHSTPIDAVPSSALAVWRCLEDPESDGAMVEVW